MVNEIPDLGFPMVTFGAKQKPWNLAALLFHPVGNIPPNGLVRLDGGAEAIFLARIDLVTRLHEEMIADIVGGGSWVTAMNRFRQLKAFFNWAGEKSLSLRSEDVERTMIAWSEHFLIRIRQNKIKETSAHSAVSVVCALLDRILNRTYPLIKHTRVKKVDDRARFHKSAGDKLRLNETTYFGSIIVAICNQLTSQVTRSALPIIINVGGHQVELWAKLQRPNARQRRTFKHTHEARQSEAKRSAAISNISLSARAPIINIRLEAELLTFIAQTGMNLEQAFRLDMDDFRYTSHLDGYQVRAYKERRSGEVLFEIFSEYRPHFERFLQWRNEWFSNSTNTRLFPFLRGGGNDELPPEFQRVRRILAKLGIDLIGPRALRKARINWLLREMDDPGQVAEIAQHDLQTLMRVYAEPHPQRAMVEISRFHQKTDPSFAPPSPGACVSPTPLPTSVVPSGATKPDCMTPAGCLFCSNHRDIDSSDHIWSLASYRYLKSLELARYRRPERKETTEPLIHPAEIAINRITEKMQFFESSSEVRRNWVQEAHLRVAEGDHHPLWEGFINIHEINVSR